MDKTKQKAKDKCQYQQAKVQNSRVHFFAGWLVTRQRKLVNVGPVQQQWSQPKSKVGVPRKTIIK